MLLFFVYVLLLCNMIDCDYVIRILSAEYWFWSTQFRIANLFVLILSFHIVVYSFDDIRISNNFSCIIWSDEIIQWFYYKIIILIMQEGGVICHTPDLPMAFNQNIWSVNSILFSMVRQIDYSIVAKQILE